MTEFDRIYLSWRNGKGGRRRIVGLIDKTVDNKFVFSYDKNEVEKAKPEGFTPYIEFPDVEKQYNGNVLDVFGQRLIRSERPDIQSFYTFWEIDPGFINDKFYLLAHTQGLLPTDNFEFLADYNPKEGLHFLTELAGLSTYKLEKGTLQVNDALRFEIESDNEYDPYAVKVFKANREIGHIKKIHCKVFHKPGGEHLRLTVKAIDQNGLIKKVFIKVAR